MAALALSLTAWASRCRGRGLRYRSARSSRSACDRAFAQDGPDRRTTLAADRTVFAAERTYAAWLRTGLAALASGVGAASYSKGTFLSG